MHKFNVRRLVVLFAVIGVLLGALLPTGTTFAAKCSITGFSLSPSGSAPKGTQVRISASATCEGGVSKMEIIAGSANLGSSNSGSISVTWDTGNWLRASVGNNNITVNAYPPGESQFDRASQSVNFVVTEGSNGGGGNPTQPPPPPNATNPPSQGGCQVTIDPGNMTVPPNTDVYFHAAASCPGGVRAIRYLFDGVDQGYYPDSTYAKMWHGKSTSQTVCAQAARKGNDGWDAPMACSRITVQGGIPPTAVPVSTHKPNPTNPPPPQPTIRANPGAKCSITSLQTTPKGQARKGTTVRITATAVCDVNVGKIEIRIGTITVARVFAVTSISFDWNTTSVSTGRTTIYAVAYASGNDSEFDRGKDDIDYLIYEGDAPPTPTDRPVVTPRLNATTPSPIVRAPIYPQARLDDFGIHLGEYCKAKYGPRAVEQHSNNDATSYRCVRDQETFPIDFSTACVEVYGDERPHASLTNVNDLGGWKCNPTDGGIIITSQPGGGGVTPTYTPTSRPQPGGGVNPRPCSNGALDSRLAVGSRGQAIRHPTRLRAAAGTDQTLLAEYASGTQFSVIGGPACLSISTWWNVSVDGGLSGWMQESNPQEGYYIGPVSGPAPVPVTRTPTPTSAPSSGCQIHSIEIGKNDTHGVVNGAVYATNNLCDLMIIEIQNTHGYWVNLKITPIGAPQLQPVGGTLNYLTTYGVLGPNATVRLNVKFNRPGEAVFVSLDLTDVSGNNAEIMNFAQGITSIMPGVGGKAFSTFAEFVPTMVNAFGSMPHLSRAAKAAHNRNIAAFRQELTSAFQTKEFDRLFEALQYLDQTIRREVFDRIYAETLSSMLSSMQAIWASLEIIYTEAFKEPAGTIVFTAR